MLPLVGIGAAGLFAFDAAIWRFPPAAFQSIAGGVSATAALTLWAFLGLEAATVPSGSIVDPARTIPRATLVGTTITAAIYILSSVGVMSLLGAGARSRTRRRPMPTQHGSSPARVRPRLVALGAAISCFGALNGWVLLVGQLPMAVARDGLFPRIFGRVSATGTPVAGMVIAGLLTTGLIALNYTRDLVEPVHLHHPAVHPQYAGARTCSRRWPSSSMRREPVTVTPAGRRRDDRVQSPSSTRSGRSAAPARSRSTGDSCC